MKTTEDLLTSTPLPQVEVNGYRQELRRRLLHSYRYLKSGNFNYRRAFYVSMGLVSAFAVILAVFIAKPGIPDQLRYAFHLDSDTPVVSNELMMAQSEDDTAFNSKIEKKGQENPLELFYSSASKDIDEVFVRLLAERQMGKKPVNIQPIAPREFYGVNRYRLDNGEDVVVYTQIPLTAVSTRESF